MEGNTIGHTAAVDGRKDAGRRATRAAGAATAALRPGGGANRSDPHGREQRDKARHGVSRLFWGVRFGAGSQGQTGAGTAHAVPMAVRRAGMNYPGTLRSDAAAPENCHPCGHAPRSRRFGGKTGACRVDRASGRAMEVSSSDPREAERRWRFPRQRGDVRAPCHANGSFQEARGGCGESADSTGTFRRVTTAKSAAVTSRGLLKRSLRHAASPPQFASQGSNVAVRRGMNEPLPAARGGQDGRAGGSGADFRKSWIGHQGEPWKFHPAIRGGRSGGGDSPGREAMFARPATRTEVSGGCEANAPSQLQ